MRPVKIKQRDITDCGAACLASVASFYQLNLPVSRIRKLAGTDKKGTNVLGLVEAAAKLGFDAKGVKGNPDSLVKIPLPAIAHTIVKNLHHYVVIYQVTSHSVEIMDPAEGKIRQIQIEQFVKSWSGVLVLLQPGPTFQPRNEQVPLLHRFWSLIRPNKILMAQTLAGALIYTLIGLSTSLFVQKIVDEVLRDENISFLNLMGIIMIGLLVLQVLAGVARNILTLRTGQLIDTRLILGYYQHLLKLPQSFFDTMRVGEIISRINDAVRIRSFVNETLSHFVVNFLILISSFALMFTFYWKLALIMLGVVPLYATILHVTNLLNRKTERVVMENAADLESQLVGSLNSISTIKSFGLEEHTHVKIKNSFLQLLKSVYTSGMNTIFTGSSTEFISRLFTIILLWTGAGFVLQREVTTGELLSFYALTSYFTGPVHALLGLNKIAQGAVIAADRLFEIMDLEMEKGLRVSFSPQKTGDIRFKDVHFRYGTRVDVFDNLNLVIPGKQVTAIVGESGSGKSTLSALIQNLYPLQSGNIYWGEHELNDLDAGYLRRRVSVVPQKIDLFAGSLIENIAVGEDQSDLQKIESICSQLGMDPFIRELPGGLQTYIGENGATLSGGQRQRIAIARALYRDPEVLILDEATSSLDSISENYVKSTLEAYRKKGKTIILIAHRLSSVVQADKIVVLGLGRVIEEGIHDELMRNRGPYFQLWKNQFPISIRSLFKE